MTEKIAKIIMKAAPNMNTLFDDPLEDGVAAGLAVLHRLRSVHEDDDN
jgi:hypothetical protein